MEEGGGFTVKPPQISQMLQKFALSFKAKAFEFFADDDDDHHPSSSSTTAHDDAADHYSETLPVLRCQAESPETPLCSPQQRQGRSSNRQFNQTLITSLFATLSSFEAAYLQLQTAHVPLDEDAVRVADKALVSHLQTLSEFKRLYENYYHNPNFSVEFSTGSCLEFQVNENQGRLRALKSVFNRLQSEIDLKDDQVSGLRTSLEELQGLNSQLSDNLDRNRQIMLTVKVFDGMLRDGCRAIHRFASRLIELMKTTGWDLDLVASSVYSAVGYAKKRHNRYAFLSYVCLKMFQGFDSECYGFSSENGSLSNGHVESDSRKVSALKQLTDHISSNPMEVLKMNPNGAFSRFCEGKYQELIHPTMESSIFKCFDEQESVIKSWKSLSDLYELFVNMASSIWTLHRLAFSFDLPPKIFQVERGAEFSMVHMEDVTGRFKYPGKERPKVGFTVVPGFKIGQTVIQSQVYLTGIKFTE
ncbi:hypothetical protein Droror1_Dr00015184 [Drosera rotundifolia]